ncbi:glycoside hydrolase family 1 protein [Caldilinea sp.]|uniref:glycoside hydrolase family 1 protein n=1 Tax=Caldilinea sp. TaxID=2293560 RepID=UPI002CB3E6AA|nr:glycoside hydrolase family 1 protein [Caldilinea sp.]HRA64917.1 glycoside hydrolase family 1 protein [Caldilinea sp.]
MDVLAQNHDELRFPEGFLWGTATSSHQVEGNNTNNQWWRFEQQPGAIWHGDRSGLACDWWRAAEVDFDLMQSLGLSTHRMSVEWSRIEPEPGRFDHAAIARYRAMLDGLRNRGMKPMVTLHHFTNPLWLEQAGGWENPEVVTRFQHFVRFTVNALRDLCDAWVTINEPLVYVAQGWVRGIWPPQKISPLGVVRVFRHMLQAHGVAYRTIHACAPDAQVGYAMPVRVFQPSDPARWLDRKAAGLKRYLAEHIWIMGAADGKIRFPLGFDDYHHALEDSTDFIGINFYTRDLVRFHPDPRRLFGEEHYHPEGEFSDSGWRGVYSEYTPQALHQIVREVNAFGKPIYITENGLPDRDDDQRPRWLLGHLHQLQRAIQDGCDVRGYYHWTFTDNFEWSEGWGLRFGLVELDPETQERRLRPSARLFSEIARNNTIPAHLVAHYAPEIMPVIFPNASQMG